MDYLNLKLTARNHIRYALQEDMDHGDLSTYAVMPDRKQGFVDLICKQDGIIAGLDVFACVFEELDSSSKTETYVNDGDEIHKDQIIARVYGDVRALLSGERTALNYLQRMSGIATKTRHIVNLLKNTNTTVVDTRKTTPGMRIFEKAATRIGGAVNHRFNLSDCIMLKDNHINAAGGIGNAVRAARASAPFTCLIEVETENINMVKEALEAKADIIMLDNMNLNEVRQALDLIQGAALTECSGNITEETAPVIASLGVDYLSCGALTHSAGILDLSLKHLTVTSHS